MIPTGHAAVIVAVMSLATILLRALPFIIFRGDVKTPPFLVYRGNVLPYAIIGMLVVYCLKDVNVFAAPHGIPEALAALTVVLLQVWRRNSLLSILAGTVLYMLLV